MAPYVLNNRSRFQLSGPILGPLLFLLVWMMDLDPAHPEVTRMAAVAVLMAVMWVTEAIPLAATSFLPVICYPLLGIMKGNAAASVYFNSTIFLFMGGFLVALAMEKWNLHKRIALFVVKTIGGGPARIVFGFMMASAFLSMWIFNTATTVIPLLLLIPATLSASCAFMMPIATPPNAIVFSSGRIRMIEMVRAGILINFIGVVVITAVFMLFGAAVFSIDPSIIPPWALLTAQ